MNKDASPFETLKQILRHVRHPDELNDHAWTRGLFVQQALDSNPQLTHVSPGQQLIGALASLFPQLQPFTPPRRGKRLDPRWGEFGLLAALYFTPFNDGTSYPTSLLDAWGRIDQAIRYFVYEKEADGLTEEQIEHYQLVGSDLAYGAPSTLSDWHRKGLQRFSEIVLNRERYLARASTRTSAILNPGEADTFDRSRSAPRRYGAMKRSLWLTITLLFVLLLSLGAHKTWKIYQSGMLLYQNVTEVRQIMQGPIELDTVVAAIPRLKVLQLHLLAFKEEARPALWLSPRLGWVPAYGDDLVSIGPLVDMAEHLLNASSCLWKLHSRCSTNSTRKARQWIPPA